MKKNKTNIFKLMLAIKKPSPLKDLCNIKHFEDISGAKEEYNAAWGQERRIMLLKPYQKRINLLVMAKDTSKNLSQDLIDDITNILKEGYGWEKYAEEKSGELFQAKAFRKIKPQECEALLEDLENHRQYFDKADCQAFMEECKPTYYQITGGEICIDKPLGESREIHLTMENALSEMESLQGMDHFKEEMLRVVDLYQGLKEQGREEEIRSYFPFHYLFIYQKDGLGFNGALRIMSSIFYHTGIIGDQVYREVSDIRDILSAKWDLPGEKRGIAALNFTPELLAESQRWLEKGSLREMAQEMGDEGEEERFVLALSAEERELDECLRSLLEEKGIPYRNLYFSDLSDEELISITRQRMKDLGFSPSLNWERELEKLFQEMRSRGNLRNLKTVDKVINRMLSASLEAQGNKKEKPGVDIFLQELHSFAREVTGLSGENCESNSQKQLEDMVGLSSLKERVKELVYSFLVNKRKRQTGMEGESLSMHMVFSGNPGTGKTTVARIIGAILKEKGLLEKGHLVEVTRKDLVGGYVGHTALKTASVIEKARGGILFIDEAYALDCESNLDYGREAVSTLVKYMEEYREEMVAILAGYTREMEWMLKMNPGLENRIPHKLYFPDYTPEELLLIFKHLMGEDYVLTKEAEEIIMELLSKGKGKGGENFSNGRFVRNLLEQLKMKQSRRLLEENLEDEKDLRVLLPEDARKLYKEEDFSNLIKSRTPKIGFTRS